MAASVTDLDAVSVTDTAVAVPRSRFQPSCSISKADATVSYCIENSKLLVTKTYQSMNSEVVNVEGQKFVKMTTQEYNEFISKIEKIFFVKVTRI